MKQIFWISLTIILIVFAAMAYAQSTAEKSGNGQPAEVHSLAEPTAELNPWEIVSTDYVMDTDGVCKKRFLPRGYFTHPDWRAAFDQYPPCGEGK